MRLAVDVFSIFVLETICFEAITHLWKSLERMLSKLKRLGVTMSHVNLYRVIGHAYNLNCFGIISNIHILISKYSRCHRI